MFPLPFSFCASVRRASLKRVAVFRLPGQDLRKQAAHLEVLPSKRVSFTRARSMSSLTE